MKSLQLESLEDRRVPATFHVPWADSRHLTLSFVPDSTPITNQSSNFTAFPNQSPASWQIDILRAFQTWAVQSNINIGIQADSGVPLGTAGLVQGDPRFGDIRIGAIPLTGEAIAIAIPPPSALSGTWAGDVIFNNAIPFGPNQVDLYSIAIHEAGHVFGLDHSPNPTSAMFDQYNNRPIQLTSEDIANLQALYGGIRKSDRWEGTMGNNTQATASSFQRAIPEDFSGSTPLVMFGDITTLSDVDFYSFRPMTGYTGPITFRLQSAGISLLAPRITILDDQGNIVGQASSANPFGDTITVTLRQVDPSKTYSIRIEGATKDVFGIGSYALAVTYDSKLKISSSVIDKVLTGHNDSLSPSRLQRLFTNPNSSFSNTGSEEEDSDEHDSEDHDSEEHDSEEHDSDETTLIALPNYILNTHYETTSSLSTLRDQDTFQVLSPSLDQGRYSVLSATVQTLSPNMNPPQVDVYDHSGQKLPSQILANGNGVFTIQATGIQDDQSYTVVVHSEPSGSIGNYSLQVDFSQRPVLGQSFTSGTLSPEQITTVQTLYVAQSQLFQFLLGVESTSPSVVGQVKMTILDSSGNIMSSAISNVGSTTSAPTLLLTPGTYQVRFAGMGLTGPVQFRVTGDQLSDPIGPLVNDPTTQPVTAYPGGPTTGYLYPGSVFSYYPFLWVASFF